MSYRGAAIELDLTSISADVHTWPEAWYFARIDDAELKISQSSGQPMIELSLELHSNNYGTGTVRDWITVNSDFGQKKARLLVAAINDVLPEDMAAFVQENPKVRLEPEYFKGKELLVMVGARPSRDGDRMFANVISPFYAPYSQAGDLLAEDE